MRIQAARDGERIVALDPVAPNNGLYYIQSSGAFGGRGRDFFKQIQYSLRENKRW